MMRWCANNVIIVELHCIQQNDCELLCCVQNNIQLTFISASIQFRTVFVFFFVFLSASILYFSR